MVAVDPTALNGLLPEREGVSAARLRLLSTALVLFGEHGYHGVSVRDITDALGQKPGAIYAHVRSKKDLLYELTKIGIEEHRDRILAALASAGDDPVEQVIEVIRAHVYVHLDYRELARMVNQEAKLLDEQQTTSLLAIRAASELALLDTVRRGIAAGEFTIDDPALAMSAIAAMGVRAAEWWNPDSHLSPDYIADTYARYAIAILR